jgi:hypothetical protein
MMVLSSFKVGVFLKSLIHDKAYLELSTFDPKTQNPSYVYCLNLRPNQVELMGLASRKCKVNVVGFRLVPSGLTTTRSTGSFNFFLTLTPSTLYVQCYVRTPVHSSLHRALKDFPPPSSPWQDHNGWEGRFDHVLGAIVIGLVCMDYRGSSLTNFLVPLTKDIALVSTHYLRDFDLRLQPCQVSVRVEEVGLFIDSFNYSIG